MTQPTKPRNPGYYQAREAWTRAYILKALVDCRGNQSKAARQLGMSRRTLLYQCDTLILPRPGAGHGRVETSLEHQQALKTALTSATAPLHELFGDYVVMFTPAPTPDKPLGYAAGVEDGRAAERKERDRLGDAIAHRAKDLEAKVAKLKADSIADQMKAQRAVNEMEHAAAAQAQRARDAEAQVCTLTAELAELRLRHIRNRGQLRMLECFEARELLVHKALARLDAYAAQDPELHLAGEQLLLTSQIRAWSFDPAPHVTEVGYGDIPASAFQADQDKLDALACVRMEISASDGGALEVTEFNSAAEFLAEHPPANRCPVPPEDHTCVSTCCDGAPLFLRPVSGVSAEEVQAMHDERIKEAFAKLGPPPEAPAVVEPAPECWGAGPDGEDPFDPKEYLS